MKKSVFLMIIAGLFLTACTSKEQDEKINAFWSEQAMKVMSSPATGEMMMKMAAARQKKEGKDPFKDQDFQKMMDALKMMQMQSGGEPFQNLGQGTDMAIPQIPAEKSAEDKAKAAVLITPTAPKTAASKNKLQQMLDAVKESNARTFKEYSFLPQSNQARIKNVMTETEDELQELVSKDADIEFFVMTQMNLLIAQENKINQIVMEDISAREEF